MIVIRTTIPLDPERRETAMRYVSELVEHSQTEAGTIRYQAATDQTSPNLLRFFEQYEDEDAAATHAESEPYRRFVEALPEFVDGDIETLRFEVDDVSAAEFTATDAVETLD